MSCTTHEIRYSPKTQIDGMVMPEVYVLRSQKGNRTWVSSMSKSMVEDEAAVESAKRYHESRLGCEEAES